RTFAVGQPERPVFVDVGAAVGYYSMLVKKKWPAAKVYAVEPLPEHIDALKETMSLNGLRPDDITLLPVAVSSFDGKASLEGQAYGSRLSKKEGKGKEAQQVVTRRLETLLAELPQVHLLK